MAKTFFENFKEAQHIFPGATFGTDSDGNIKLAGGGIRNINLPDAFGNYNTAAYNARVAVPFSFNTLRNDGNGKASSTRRSGILYMPYYEAEKISDTGKVDAKDAEIYGAELDNISLTREGFQQLFSDKNNSNFKFDLYPAANALAQSKNRDTRNQDYDAKRYQADEKNFIRNLRSWLWGL